MANEKIVYVERKQTHGCLVTALVFLLFGWLGLAAMALWKGARLAWALLVTYPVKWTLAATRWTWQWSVRGSRALTARYGWRGWAVVGGVVVALAIISSIMSALGAGH